MSSHRTPRRILNAPAATITVRDPNAHARMVVHDNDTYCTLDEQDLVRCGLETKTAYVIALP